MQQRLSSDDIRETFLDFFVSRGHKRISGSRLVPQNDPTLLFVNSGMAPLKAYFTGQQTPPNPDLTNVQPCLRTRDIDDVGDRHHLTFFEMLGSWSIGGYFKQHAIELAHELLVDRFGLAPERLYVSVFGGEPSLNLAPDDEAAAHWQTVGIPQERIVALPMSDNFWGPAGDTGPCGPCTEVFYDFGPDYGPEWSPGQEFVTTGRYIEIWNAGVFMQFDKRRDGTFGDLPFASVDTGSGLERLTMALNELPTIYDVDLMAPLVALTQDMLGQRGDVLDHHRLIADHLRAATFILGEGVRPSNEGRGYIPRRLIRKCVAVARREGARGFAAGEIAERVITLMSPHYPNLLSNKDVILRQLDEEEEDFSRAVQRGLDHLEELYRAENGISGADAFRLFSTYGLPFELTRDLAAERGTPVDEEAYRAEFRRHQEASRGTGTPDGTGRLSSADPLPDLPLPGRDHFLGYETTSADSRVVAVFRDGREVQEGHEGDELEVLLDRTPFYAEGGGQVGDRGVLHAGNGTFSVRDTVKHGTGYHVHRGLLAQGSLKAREGVRALVDEQRRHDTEANHSATHLLNAALRDVLGPHVLQAGSLVEPGRLRFDFTNPAPVTPAQLLDIERHVNRDVLANRPRTVEVMSSDEAKKTDAVYLEDEDYGDSVRVVSFVGASTEFCGGTHVRRTSEIGLFRVTAEQSVASGVRRINAVTRAAALDLTLERDQILSAVSTQLKVRPDELPQRVEQLMQSARTAKSKGAHPAAADHVALTVDRTGPVPTASAVAAEPVDIRGTAARQAEALGAVVCIAGGAKGRTRAVVAVPRALAERLDARAILDYVLKPVGGTGGGSAGLAQGGGAPTDDLRALLARVPGAVAGTPA